MKKILILGLALTLGLGTVGNALAETKVRNNKMVLSGENTTQTLFAGSDIKALEASFAWEVTLVEGNEGVTINIPKEYQDMIICKLDGDKLTLGFNPNNLPREVSHVDGSNKFSARVSISALRDVVLSGGASIIINGRLDANCSETRIIASGGSRFIGNGTLKCKEFSATFSGGAYAEMPKLECKGGAQVVSSGGATVSIAGTASIADVACSGASVFNGQELITEAINAVCSGASKASIYVQDSEKSHTSCSGASSIIIHNKSGKRGKRGISIIKH